MSIDGWIKQLVDGKRLYLIESPFMSDHHSRTLLVSKEIHDLVNPPWPNTRAEVRFSKLRADLENFACGGEMSVCTEPFQGREEDLAVLDPKEDGVWDLRSRNPSPGLRIIGQFADRDVFFGAVLATRSKPESGLRGPLGAKDSEQWKSAISDCRKTFNGLFNPAFSAVAGGRIEDVLSERYH